ncbi:hypothetical protein [Chitinophaga filiformis]|uniref:Uncharacterized protein n=1 Tax=Chitinophaga filiformis TaxID=104663 RepID=A0A1G8AEW7_CHIFI|nr:hypothetical protein [Chitinophaga filiformis]SDH19441.1 hypothetical protein SAMN04488121_109227 [Chitinophaga filiformis]
MLPITKRRLTDEFGIDYEIATFFADRTPPDNNHFWKGKYVYLSNSLGYTIIPFLFDLQYKLGVEKSILLDEKHIRLMEDGFDLMAKYEAKQIGYEDFIGACRILYTPTVANSIFFSDLLLYLNNRKPLQYTLGSPVKALNRADAFFFTLCDVPVEEQLLHRIIEAWSYVKVNALILDDISDLEQDKINGEENSIIELGGTEAAMENIQSMFKTNVESLAGINNKLAHYFETCMTLLQKRPTFNDSANSNR